MDLLYLPDMIYREKKVDPLDLIHQFFDTTSVPLVKGQLNELMMAAFAGIRAKWITENPAILLSKYEQFHWLLIACHLIHENKFHLISRTVYSHKTLKKIKLHTKPLNKKDERNGYTWQHYPYFLTKDEMSAPFLVIRNALTHFTFGQWKQFLNDAIYSALNYKEDNIWMEIENALPCFIYLHKLIEATYLIYAEETDFGKTVPNL